MVSQEHPDPKDQLDPLDLKESEIKEDNKDLTELLDLKDSQV